MICNKADLCNNDKCFHKKHHIKRYYNRKTKNSCEIGGCSIISMDVECV